MEISKFKKHRKKHEIHKISKKHVKKTLKKCI